MGLCDLREQFHRSRAVLTSAIKVVRRGAALCAFTLIRRLTYA